MVSDPAWACAQTVHLFFRCIDDGQPAHGAALFTENGVWLKRGAAIAGRAAILATMQERRATIATRHIVTNMIVEPQGSEMRARYYVTTFADEESTGAVARLGPPAVILDCEDRLVADGDRWSFLSRSSRPVFAGA